MHLCYIVLKYHIHFLKSCERDTDYIQKYHVYYVDAKVLLFSSFDH